ncbi:MAG: hypothetical protein R3C20_03840 [Planctomycetaceae bacterium]
MAASDALHQEIVAIEEEIFQELGICYRLIDTATGDLGGPAWPGLTQAGCQAWRSWRIPG